MCFDLDSLPPIPVIAGAAVSHEDLVLESADGTRFAAFAATPDEPSGNGIVILPDIRGLYRFYEELALRFGERGHTAVAIDYFGRTAGAAKRDDDFEYRPHVEQTTTDGVQADTAGGGRVARRAAPVGLHGRLLLRRPAVVARRGVRARPCRRGRLLRAAGRARTGSPGPAQRASELAAPILGLMGGADAGHPASRTCEAFERALEQAGVEHEILIYDGAPHSFFDRK